MHSHDYINYFGTPYGDKSHPIQIVPIQIQKKQRRLPLSTPCANLYRGYTSTTTGQHAHRPAYASAGAASAGGSASSGMNFGSSSAASP